jgi:tetratricopeptide (TPR) repeat protein
MHMTRALKPCTIIPQNLYVERAADRQLSRIIDEMGRPGYVLVARQMGKTNLLLNAKRKVGFDDIFVYLDVSNSVPDVRSFFRSIVDLAIENIPGGNESLRCRIDERRQSNDAFLEHKEHEVELREIIRTIGGKLVICIDEIDALTKVDYSDQVFSFIRSTYFSGRTNFPEFERLTYVLSGVAEPSELIKNRAISPFNIGEKIYLEDFSRPEFEGFISQAGLSFSDAAVERVFHWTNGNPRLSWDVCSAIEASGHDPDVEAVDAMVQRLYFESYDLPPIDHIRTLVQADKEVRGAIMSIHYGRSSVITDAVKGRLYLAGVISNSSSGEDVVVKNRVIEQAISEKWLSEIERSEQSALEYADSLFWGKRYAEAIIAYEEYAKTGGEDLDPDQHRMNRARSYYLVGRYRDAISELDGGLFPKSRSFDQYILSLSTLAAAHLSAGDLAKSIPLYERVIKELVGVEGYAPLDYHRAQLDLSNACLALEPPNLERAAELCESVVSSLAPENNGGDEFADRLRSLAHHNLYRVAVKTGNQESAIAELDLAIFSAQNSDRAVLLLEKAVRSSTKIERTAALAGCVEHCFVCQVQLSELRILERPLSFKLAAAAQLAYELALLESEMGDTLDRFISYCNDPAIGHDVDVFRVVILAARFALSQRRDDLAMRLYLKAALLPSVARSDERVFVTSTGILVANDLQFESFFDYFVCDIAPVARNGGIPLAACHRMINHMINEGDDEGAVQVLSAMGVDKFEMAQLVTIDDCINAFMMLRASSQGMSGEVLFSNVNRLYAAVGQAVLSPESFYTSGHSKVVASQIMRVFPTCFALRTVQRTGRKFSRNDVVRVRFADGSVVEGKYKKFQSEIVSGRVEIIDEP